MTLPKDEEIKRRGCSPVENIIIPDSKMEDLINFLNNTPMAKEKFYINRMKLDDIKRDGRCFMNSHFQLHKIPYIKFYKVPLTRIGFVKIKDIHPYDLPIGFVIESGANGAVEEFFSPDEKIYFKSIGIGENISELSSSSYIHEITHTQLDSLKGSYDNYFNQEVLSIFLEFFHSATLNEDEKLLRLEEANRIYELSELTKQQVEYSTGRLQLSREDLIENSKYIQSDLIVFHLFHKFYYSSLAIKKEMLKDIQKIFNGDLTVEEYLNKYEVSFSNSQDKNTIKKYLYRMGK